MVIELFTINATSEKYRIFRMMTGSLRVSFHCYTAGGHHRYRFFFIRMPFKLNPNIQMYKNQNDFCQNPI